MVDFFVGFYVVEFMIDELEMVICELM